MGNIPLSEIIKSLESLSHELDGVGFTVVSNMQDASEAVVRIWAKNNTWSRKARRRLERLRKENMSIASTPLTSTLSESDAGVVILVRCFTQNEAGTKFWTLEASWVRGPERELFESLWSHLSRKVLDQLG